MSGHIMSRIGQPHDRNTRTVAHERAPRSVVGFTQDYPDGFATEPHRHRRAQLLYTISGVLRVVTDDARYALPPGTGLFIPPTCRTPSTWMGRSPCARCSCAPTPRGWRRPG